MRRDKIRDGAEFFGFGLGQNSLACKLIVSSLIDDTLVVLALFSWRRLFSRSA